MFLYFSISISFVKNIPVKIITFATDFCSFVLPRQGFFVFRPPVQARLALFAGRLPNSVRLRGRFDDCGRQFLLDLLHPLVGRRSSIGYVAHGFEIVDQAGQTLVVPADWVDCVGAAEDGLTLHFGQETVVFAADAQMRLVVVIFWQFL